MQWKADKIAANPCDDDMVAIAAFSGEFQGEPSYLVLSRYLVPGDDDGVYIERDDQILASYEGIADCRLSKDRLEIELIADAATKMKVSGGKIKIELDASADDFWQLRRALAVIFLGKHVYHDVSS